MLSNRTLLDPTNFQGHAAEICRTFLDQLIPPGSSHSNCAFGVYKCHPVMDCTYNLITTTVDWYRVLEGEDCLGKTVLLVKGPSTETETWMKSFQRTVFIIVNGAELNITYSTCK
ncbi:hypothetical protein P879_04034 [Paragonimus westermani]|uniref:Uncharacterized protein n=1 Tax=Paragonimus westermani TaxID=34504 RepID=A0A8T0DA63_9TREM|nr:hypothetical protein P879_04034 [Paragonimus westermani]